MLREEEKSLEKKLNYENTSMPNSPCSIPATPDEEEEDSSQNKRRLGSGYQMAKLTLPEAEKRMGANLTRTGLPRWHNQSYMLFVSLRQHSEKTMSRTDLIKKALDFDKKISQERNLPRVFRGKTPMNSASAILTNNADHYFVSFRPDGSKSLHFKLSFEPSNFEKAYKEYRDWEERLIRTDWPLHFGENKAAPEQTIVESLQVTQYQPEYLTEFDAFLASRKRARLSLQEPIIITNNNNNNNNNNKKPTLTNIIHHNNTDDVKTNGNSLPGGEPSLLNDSNSQLPLKWSDIVTVHHHKLYAIRPLPENTPLGYYFGVPMTEDEFDCIKDGVGQASNYAMLYQRTTVLDATDSEGALYTTPGQSIPLCPFHYIQETSDPEGANIIFLEGMVMYQIICWTKRAIVPGEPLFVFNMKKSSKPENGKVHIDTLLDTSSSSG
ncbi:hypothetical protein K501DRAFT_245950 [Backusella circina FSU 941]|nr:hypothetical protein K501DRAFT_245950 [Backusella circina FSU 941]